MDKKQNQNAKKALGQSYQYGLVAAGCMLAISAAWALRSTGYEVSLRHYLAFHTLAETISIVFSFAVFTTAWFGYRSSRSARDLVLGITFLTSGAFDLIHMMTYKGMPVFLTMSNAGIAAGYWTFARLISSTGLLAASALGSGAPSRRFVNALSAVAAVLLSGSIFLMTYYAPDSGKLFFDRGLTELKIVLEFLVVILYVAAFISISETREWETPTVRLLRTAIIFAAAAELAFCLYDNVYGPVNMLGHIFKAIAYYLILRALFVSAIRRPYEELNRAKEEVHEMYLHAQEHRKEIERSFSQIGNALSSSLKLEEALDLIAELGTDMLHADCVIVASLEKNSTVRIAAQKGGCGESDRPVELTLQAGLEAVRRGTSILMNNLESANHIKCNYNHEKCLRSMICSPMLLDGQARGLIAIYSREYGAFDDGDIKLLEGFASHAAIAMANAISYERESRIADVLQKSILDLPIIAVPNFDIAGVYQPALDEALVGGDFYDVINMRDGRVGLVIGDVSGKGLSAAVHTALVKYTLRAYVAEEHSPSEVISLLNRLMVAQPDMETFVTLFFGVLDPHRREMVYVSAGHEPALFACDDGWSMLSSTGPALGFTTRIAYEENTVKFCKGDALLIYTDGISEARRGSDFMGTERLAEALDNCRDRCSEDIAVNIHRGALDFAGGSLRDDAAIIAIKAE